MQEFRRWSQGAYGEIFVAQGLVKESLPSSTLPALSSSIGGPLYFEGDIDPLRSGSWVPRIRRRSIGLRLRELVLVFPPLEPHLSSATHFLCPALRLPRSRGAAKVLSTRMCCLSSTLTFGLADMSHDCVSETAVDSRTGPYSAEISEERKNIPKIILSSATKHWSLGEPPLSICGGPRSKFPWFGGRGQSYERYREKAGWLPSQKKLSRCKRQGARSYPISFDCNLGCSRLSHRDSVLIHFHPREQERPPMRQHRGRQQF